MTNRSYTDEQVLEAAIRMEKLADPVRHLGDETGWMTDDVAKMLRQLHAKCQRLQAQVEAFRRGIEHAAESWDGCMYDAVGEDIDIGESIRGIVAAEFRTTHTETKEAKS